MALLGFLSISSSLLCLIFVISICQEPGLHIPNPTQNQPQQLLVNQPTPQQQGPQVDNPQENNEQRLHQPQILAPQQGQQAPLMQGQPIPVQPSDGSLQQAPQVHQAPGQQYIQQPPNEPLNQAPIQQEGHQVPVVDQPQQVLEHQQAQQIPHSPQAQQPPVMQQPAVQPPPVPLQPTQTLHQQTDQQVPHLAPQQPPLQQIPQVQQKQPHQREHHDEAPDAFNQFRHHHVQDASRSEKDLSGSQRVIHNDPEIDILMQLPTNNIQGDEDDYFFSSPKYFVSMTFIVRPGTKDCYFYNAVSNFDVEYQVLRGDNLDIGLLVLDPNGVPVFARGPAPEANAQISVRLEHRSKPFAICLDNRKASFGEKTVFMGIDLRLNWKDPAPEDLELIESINKKFKLDPQREDTRQHFEKLERLSNSVEKTATRLHRVQRLQQRSKNNAAIDRIMMEGNQQRVVTWSTFQLFVLLFVGLVQTFLIRSLFDEKSSLHRLWVRGDHSYL